MGVVENILGKRPEWAASVAYVDKLAKKVQKRYKVSKEDARDILDEASAYNINDEADLFYVIEAEILPNWR